MNINPIDKCNTISLILVDGRPACMRPCIICHYPLSPIV